MSTQNTQAIEMILGELRENILDRWNFGLDRAHRHGARNVRLFGSVVRGEATENSDIDFLVDAGEKTSPWFPAGLIDELETLLGRRVDVVTEDSLHWLLRRRILKEARPL
jgi:predicted nucleotidyltransferase